MSARRIKKTWWVDFTFNQTRHRKRSPVNSRAGALAYEAVLRQRLTRGEPIEGLSINQAKNMPSFGEFSTEWFDLYVTANNKSSEQYAKKCILRSRLVPFFGKKKIGSITTEDVERYKVRMQSRGITNKTINNHLTVLGKCLRCAEEWRGAQPPAVKLLRCLPPKTDYLTPSECQAILAGAQGQLFEMLLLALRTGMRQGEIRGLQWNSIDWQSETIAVQHSLLDRTRTLASPKNGKARYIPLDAEVRDALLKRREVSGYVFVNAGRAAPYTGHRLQEDLQAHCERIGLRKIGWHVLRHTFATQLIMRGVPITVAKELLGHSSITTTMRYSHVAPSALRAAIDTLNSASAKHDFGQRAVNRNDEIAENGFIYELF